MKELMENNSSENSKIIEQEEVSIKKTKSKNWNENSLDGSITTENMNNSKIEENKNDISINSS